MPVRWRPGDVAAAAAPFAVAAVGGAATVPAIPAWYRGLRKPRWNPPDGIFGPVWTALYALMAIAAVLARRAAAARPAGSGGVRLVDAAHGLQLGLNLAWSLVFFGRRDPKAGLAVIAMLWLAIVATIATFARFDRRAALLLVPYLAWVTFAAGLNEEIWRRNR